MTACLRRVRAEDMLGFRHTAVDIAIPAPHGICSESQDGSEAARKTLGQKCEYVFRSIMCVRPRQVPYKAILLAYTFPAETPDWYVLPPSVS